MRLYVTAQWVIRRTTWGAWIVTRNSQQVAR